MSILDKIIKFCIENKLVVFCLLIFFVIWGIIVSPFNWHISAFIRDPVAVDAIPDIGENQQIVFTKWPGRSPQDVEDQITYPLTTALLGIPGVKTIRSNSMFGFSSIYVIFDEKIDFYWSRSRIIEKLNSLPSGMPDGVTPALGPDATALGQVFWYTLEGRDKDGNITGKWDLDELRSVQDWYVRYALLSAEGVSEVASVGGFVREYQIDADPDLMRIYNISLDELSNAVRMSNLDIGANTIEINKVDYTIRGIGFIKKPEEIAESVIKTRNSVPVYIKNVAHVSFGPAARLGALDKSGTEAVGGVAVVRYGANPMEVIKNLKEKIAEIAPGMPKKTLADGTESQLTIVPFYDRSGLIEETLGTLSATLYEQILVTIIVVAVMVMHFRSALLISILLPLTVLICFIAMKLFGITANIVALSGIAIAIGTIVDMGIIICENILRHIDMAEEGEKMSDIIFRASSEVGSAIFTAISTTIVSFLPVFTMQQAEGKLFRPLAFTKTFALLSSLAIALTIIPPLAHLLFIRKKSRFFEHAGKILNIALLLSAAYLLSKHWMPLGTEKGIALNFIFAGMLIALLLLFFKVFHHYYIPILRSCLNYRKTFLLFIIGIVLFGNIVWIGFSRVFFFLPDSIRQLSPVVALSHSFPGLGKEFMPPLDEGSYLYMPTTMPHASIGETLDILQKQDMAITAIPEVENSAGKLGRADSPLDPAPISMIETIINYKSEYIDDASGKHLTYRFDPTDTDLFRAPDGTPVNAVDGKPYYVKGKFIRDEKDRLIPESGGKPFRLWRPALDPALNKNRDYWPGINTPDDIWNEIESAADMPGVTSAPKLQPIFARIVMLQSGMRAPMGIKIKGPDLASIEKTGLKIEQLLKNVPSIEPATVFADRIIGKPYLEIIPDRAAIARYGVNMVTIQNTIETAIGGKKVSTSVEGRERYSIRIRYLREERDSIESIKRILVTSANGTAIPLQQLADIQYSRGPQMIRSEDTFLTGYVLFDKKSEYAEVDVVEQARNYLKEQQDVGVLNIPAGINYTFAGSYENQVRSEKRLRLIIPLALFVIFIILYLEFKSVPITAFVFSGIAVAWCGGFIMIWLYSQGWFGNFSVAGVNMRDLFQMHELNLSVAIWVGFIALFGIATDDGVVMTTYLEQTFATHKPETKKELRKTVIAAASRRVRPCLMTTATTILALIPVLSATGRGSDIMVPMAIPSLGGMVIEIATMLVVPVLYSIYREYTIKAGS